MHQLVLARCSVEDLLQTLGRLTAPFVDVPPGRESVDPHVDGEPVLVGHVHGLAYLSENAGTVFAICWSLLARLARELDTLVVGSTCDLGDHNQIFMAEGAKMVRAFWSNPGRATKPYSLGEPLASEAESPLSAPAGAGLTAALREFGYTPVQYEGDTLLPGERWVTWQGDPVALLQADELAAQVNEHVRANENPDFRPPVPVVRVRRMEEERD